MMGDTSRERIKMSGAGCLKNTKDKLSDANLASKGKTETSDVGLCNSASHVGLINSASHTGLSNSASYVGLSNFVF